jgi:hypothetical protein
MHLTIWTALHPGNKLTGLMSVNVPADPNNRPYPSGLDPKTWAGPWRTVSEPEEIVQRMPSNTTKRKRPLFAPALFYSTLVIVQTHQDPKT